MSTKVFIEILTEDDSSTALSKVSELLGDYTISSIKTSPANTLRSDSKDIQSDSFDDLKAAREEQIKRIQNANKY
ncbi:hypothetical protein NIES25_70260 (plasmid) [Nostoc linckia NIES-25]|nr:hypothetical protein NIES25_70260 [Nostoc linckia NIES-25]